MKKLFYVIGALVTAASVFAVIAILLKKLKISLCIESLEDDDALCDCAECCSENDITVTIDDDSEQEVDEIEVEFTQEDLDEVEIDPEIEKEIMQAEQPDEKKTKKAK